MRRRSWLFAGVVLCDLILTLLAAELFIAMTGLDMRLLRPLLYYQGADLAVHRVSEDVARHYELRPGRRAVFGGRAVSIDSLGFRGPERRARKAPGTFRIVCLGSSNTYGAAVQDQETYPAQLEALLNRGRRGRFEVWNAGVSAYRVSQCAAAARAIVERFAPDLLVFQVNNGGRRPFLSGEPFARFFAQDPDLYAENLRHPAAGGRGHAALMRRWRLYRVAVIAYNRWRLRPDSDPAITEHDDFNMRAFADFAAASGARLPIVLLGNPGGGIDPRLQVPGTRTLELSRELPSGWGPEFRETHPPAHVYAWYAARIAAFLRREGLLPRRA
jgi:hypothetical protein